MASLYKKNNTWFVSVQVNGKRISRSLKTNNFSTAKRLESKIEYELIMQLIGLKEDNKELGFKELSDKFLNQKSRANSTQLIYENAYKNYLAGKPLPSNPNSRGMHIRAINACWNWGLKKALLPKHINLIWMLASKQGKEHIQIKS